MSDESLPTTVFPTGLGLARPASATRPALHTFGDDTDVWDVRAPRCAVGRARWSILLVVANQSGATLGYRPRAELTDGWAERFELAWGERPVGVEATLVAWSAEPATLKGVPATALAPLLSYDREAIRIEALRALSFVDSSTDHGDAVG